MDRRLYAGMSKRIFFKALRPGLVTPTVPEWLDVLDDCPYPRAMPS